MTNEIKNNLIAVYSASKGVGKTWFAGILSQTLSMLEKKVLFFDADGGIENIAYQFGLKSSDLYLKMLKNDITLNNAVQTCPNGRFDMICAQPAQNDLNAYPIGRSQILAQDLKNFAPNYDYVIIDCSNNNQKLKNIFLHCASKIILIIEPSLKSSTGAYKELEQIKKISADAQTYILVNHALSYNEGEQIFKTLLTADKQYIGSNPIYLGTIKQNGRIRDCVKNKTTLYDRYPVSESITEIKTIAQKLINEEN